ATISAPMMPLAPPRLSTTSCCPSRSVSRAARKRPRMSLLPPGGNGITQRMGLVGKASAACAADREPAARASATHNDRLSGVMRYLLLVVSRLALTATLFGKV